MELSAGEKQGMEPADSELNRDTKEPHDPGTSGGLDVPLMFNAFLTGQSMHPEKQSRNEVRRLEALRTYDVAAPESHLDRIVQLAARVTDCPIAMVCLVDAERLWVKAWYGAALVEPSLDQAFSSHAIADPSRPLIVRDAREDVRFLNNELVNQPPGVRFYAGMPLVNPEGHALGTLCVIDLAPRELGDLQIDVLAELTQNAMTVFELRRARATALAAEKRFARVFEATPTALVLAGSDGRIVMINHHAERVFGYDRRDLMGRPVETLMAERFRRQHPLHRQRFLTEMSSRQMGKGQELFGLRDDGTEFPLEIGLNPVELDGEPMVLAGIIDITARRQIEQERERQRRDLARSNKDLEEFAYIASHDLKAPMRGIAHLVEWIFEDLGTSASPETAENLNLLRGRVARLQKLQDGLLAYSRVGRAGVEVENVDLADIVNDIVAILAPPPGFTVSSVGTMPILRTHRLPLQVVLENLIGNALKHSDRPEGQVTVSARKTGEMTEFRVSDDGPGIPPRFHDRIFEIFQTLASRDDVESSGMGLAIVKKQVETHGGKIWVESAPPARGTTFVFTWKESTE